MKMNMDLIKTPWMLTLYNINTGILFQYQFSTNVQKLLTSLHICAFAALFPKHRWKWCTRNLLTVPLWRAQTHIFMPQEQLTALFLCEVESSRCQSDECAIRRGAPKHKHTHTQHKLWNSDTTVNVSLLSISAAEVTIN